MPREDERDRRDRSRSRRRDNNRGRDDKKDDKKPEEKKSVSDAAKSGSSEQEIVSVAIRQLPAEIRERLEKLFEEGLLKEGDLDLRSITVFASLNEGLQARVMNHMESERIYVANARSKSGFLIATCDKAKTGCLDARGLGAIDPWMTALVAMATPKQKMVDLKPERDWLDEKDVGPIKININVADVEKEVGQASVTVELPLSETTAAMAAKLQAMGVKSIPTNKMKFHHEAVGFLKNCHSFAFYNFEDGAEITLSARKRAGVKFKKDHTVMPKRPRTYEKAKEAAAKAQEQANKSAQNAAPKGALPNLPGMPNLPKLPGLLGTGPLPGMPGLPGLPGLGGSMPGMPQLGKLGGLPGLPGMPPLGKLGGLPGLPPPGADPKAAAMAAMAASMPGLGLGLPGGPDPKAADLSKMVEQLGKAPGLGLGLPGLPPPGADPKAAAIAMMAKAGLPSGPPGLGGPGGTAPAGGGTAKSAMAAGSTPKGGGVPAV